MSLTGAELENHDRPRARSSKVSALLCSHPIYSFHRLGRLLFRLAPKPVKQEKRWLKPQKPGQESSSKPPSRNRSGTSGALHSLSGQEIRRPGKSQIILESRENSAVLAKSNVQCRRLESGYSGTYAQSKRPAGNPAGLCKFTLSVSHRVRFRGAGSALTCLEPTLGLVDDVHAAFAAHDPTITVPVLQRAERVLDLHGSSPFALRRGPAPVVCGCFGNSETINSWWAVLGSNQ